MLSYTPQDARNFNALSPTASFSSKFTTPPQSTTSTAAFLSSMLFNAYNNQNKVLDKDLIKKSSTFCTNSTATNSFVNRNNLVQGKVKKPLHIVQDEQRLTINLLNTVSPYSNNNNNSNLRKKQTHVESMPSSLVAPKVQRPLPLPPPATYPSKDSNYYKTVVAINPNTVVEANKSSKKQSLGRLCLFSRLKARNKSSDTQPSLKSTESFPKKGSNDYKEKRLDLVKTLASNSDNIRLKNFILKHLRQLPNEGSSSSMVVPKVEKKIVKSGDKTKTTNLRTIISEAGENWTHFYMPIILIADLKVGNSMKKMIENFESTTCLYKNNEETNEENTSKALIYNKSALSSESFTAKNSSLSFNKTSKPLNVFNSDRQPKTSENLCSLEQKHFNINIEQNVRPLTMSSMISQSNSNKIYSSIASSNNNTNNDNNNNNKESIKQSENKNILHQENRNKIVISNKKIKKQSLSESNRTSNDDEKILKSSATMFYGQGSISNTGSSDPSDPEQSNNRLIALKNEIDKTMNEINSFKNEVSFRIKSAVESLTQFDYGKYIQNSSNGSETLMSKGFLTISSDINNDRKHPHNDGAFSTVDTGVNTDISMCNAVFKIKYDDEEEEISDDNLNHNDVNDKNIGEAVSIEDMTDDENQTEKSCYSNNSQTSKGCLTRYSNRFEFTLSNRQEIESNQMPSRIMGPIPVPTLLPLIESPTDTNSSTKMAEISLMNQKNKFKKKKPELFFTNSSNEIKSNEFQNTYLSYVDSKIKTKQKQSQDKEKRNTSKKILPYSPESFDFSNTTKSSNSNVFTKVFSRLEANRFRSQSPSSYSFTNLNTSNSSESSFSALSQIEHNTDKKKFRSNLSSKYLTKQNVHHSPAIRENYFEPIVDNIIDDDESTLINADKDSPILSSRPNRRSNRKSNIYPQPLTKLPVHDFGRTFSSDFRDRESDEFRLKIIPLKRSLTPIRLENSNSQNIYQQQGKYFQSYQAKRSPRNEHVREPEYYNHHLKDYFNSNMYSQYNNMSNKFKENSPGNEKETINMITSQMFRKMSTTTTQSTSMPKQSNAIGFYNLINKKNMYKEYAAFCTCDSSKKRNDSKNYIKISDKRYMDHNTVILNNSRQSRKTKEVKKYQEELPLDFSNNKLDKRSLKSNDLNLNLNNILKNNPYRNYLNIESSDYDEDEEDMVKSFDEVDDVNEIYFRKKGAGRSLLNSFHRPHSSIQFENQEAVGNEEFYENSINIHPFMSTNYYKSVLKNRVKHFNILNEGHGGYDLNNNYTKSYSEVDQSLFDRVNNRHGKDKSRIEKTSKNTEGIISKSPIRFPILQKNLENRNIPYVYKKNNNHLEKSKKRSSKKQKQPTTKYLINYPISSLSDSTSNQSFVKNFEKNKNIRKSSYADNENNTTSNVDSNFIESSSSNVLTPLETKSTVVLNEFKLS